MENTCDKVLYLIMFSCLLLLMHSNSLSQSLAARVLDENSTPDDGHGKAEVVPHQPRSDNRWSGNSPPSGLLTPPPASVTQMSYKHNNESYQAASCSQSNNGGMASGTRVTTKSCSSVTEHEESSYFSASTVPADP